MKDKKQEKISVVTNECMAETIYDKELQQTHFAVLQDGKIDIRDEVRIADEIIYPLSPDNAVVNKRVILLPSEVSDYGTTSKLIADVKNYIHKYVMVTEPFEDIATYYTLFSWIHDKFNELPYLRAIGDYGTGKTRFLQVVGSICYKPIFAGGATTTSPIFRMLDEYNGTLVLDEADFAMSDKTADIIKILNQGYSKDFPVMRSADKQGGFEVQTFDVYSPKILATREHFKDQALESRCLVEEMGLARMREGIPRSLDDEFRKESLELRNKLLKWRFDNYHKKVITDFKIDLDIHPRLAQIAIPILNIVDNDESRDKVFAFVKKYNEQLVAERGLSYVADILKALILLMRKAKEEGGDGPTVKEITEKYNDMLDIDGFRMSDKKMGHKLRNKLHINPVRKANGYVVGLLENQEKINVLQDKYCISEEDLRDDWDINMNDVNVVNLTEKGDDLLEIPNPWRD